jgi:CRP/FNR family transcriptional regulator, cyclic AMP receptor protein
MRLADILGLNSIQPVSRGKALRMVRKAPLFRAMSNAALSDLLDESAQTFYDSETIIVRQGDRADKVYMVLSGRVRVVYEEGQKEVSVADLGPGEVFGEMAVLEGQPRSANVITLERTNLLEVPGPIFTAALKQARQS